MLLVTSMFFLLHLDFNDSPCSQFGGSLLSDNMPEQTLIMINLNVNNKHDNISETGK